MQLKKTKLAGIISLALCSNAMAVQISEPPIAIQTDDSRFGPFVSAMDTSSAASSTATYTNTYAQPFTYDIGAPWTYNEYCIYDSDVCEMYWNGTTSSNGNDGLYVWRRNILNTFNNYNGEYKSDATSSFIGSILPDSRKITAMDGTTPVGYGSVGSGTSAERIVRQGFYGDQALSSSFVENNGFSAAHDATLVTLTGTNNIVFTPKTLVVGQSSVNWANADDENRFSYCFDYQIYDERGDYSDLYNCPGFDLQATFWGTDGAIVDYFSNNDAKTWLSGGSSALFIANAYAINTSGFAVGFSSKEINGSATGRARATVFKPSVVAAETLKYTMSEIVRPTDDDAIRDTVAIDITDTVYNKPAIAGGEGTFSDANGTDASQAFIVVGNRTFNQPQNRSYATEFYAYDIANPDDVRYPFQGDPIKGANSQVSKINNDGLVVGWRDARGETSPTADGSPRFQSAFIYDYKNNESAYLDDMYCASLASVDDVRYRFSNAISISENTTGDPANASYTIVANGFDYVNVENYKNRVGSTPVVLSMTVSSDDLASLPTTSQCPIKADEDYERSGAGMGWFILLPSLMLLFRRFKR